MGTITGISDLDPVRWPNSHWRSVKVSGLNVCGPAETMACFLCCYSINIILSIWYIS